MGEMDGDLVGFGPPRFGRAEFEKVSGKKEKVSLLQGKTKSNFHVAPPRAKGLDYINAGEEDQMEIFGFVEDRFRTVITWIVIVSTAFLLRLVFHWKPEWMLYCTHVRCALDKAHKVLLTNHYHQIFVETIRVIRTGEKITQEKSLRDPILNQLVDENLKLTLPDCEGSFQEVESIRFFENRSSFYIWDGGNNEFYKLQGLEKVPCSYFYKQKGLSQKQQTQRRAIFGPNSIQVPVQSIFRLMFLEVLNPFYVFQVFSVCLWYADNYNYYASCIVIISAISIGTSVIQTRANQKSLRNTVQSSDIMNVWRGNEVYESIPSDNLVPGDVLVIPSRGCMMLCDAVLISGNCIVNESMLTGESVPITKTPIPNPALLRAQLDETYNAKEHAKHTLFCGTKVIQTRYYGSEKVKAIVIRSGFMTCKGELVRSIMYPKPLDFKFQQDSYRFIGVLFSVAVIGFLYTVVRKVLNNTSAGDIALDALDLITIVVPPALPAAMTVGIAYAQARLRKSNIYCISPRAINISGCLNCVCFDKTGTLTEDGLDMWGTVPAENQGFQQPLRSLEAVPCGPLIVAMATCHSLTIIDGQLSGDPLDLKMFEGTNWILEEPEIDETAKFDIITPTVVKPKHPVFTGMEGGSEQLDETPFEIGIVRQFTFSSSLQRMSVITRLLGGRHFEIYTKGSPEMIASLCNPVTVPYNFTEVLVSYTQHGFRVLAMATKPLPKITYAKVQRIARDQVECNLTFLGLLIMENRLKPETTPIIRKLKKADIRTIMVTGDNMLTALSVARDCEMIEKSHRVILVNLIRNPIDKSHDIQFAYAEMPDKEVEEVEYVSKANNSTVIIEEQGEKFHFAISGKTFALIRDYLPDLIPKLVVRGTVFARMSPDQKKQLIEHLQELGYYVGMCGDGANDCGALKAAHAGLSLSEAEASVASPFTSKEPNISCVPSLIREGRSALVTSFGIFKYMACYSFTQFVSVMILYSIESNLTDMEFLYIDLFIITILAATFGKTEPYPALDPNPPPSSLISVTPLTSIALQMILMILAQVFTFFFVQQQPWYSPHVAKTSDDVMCYENYSVFAVSAFQYITLAIVFSKGAPYRKTIFSNYFFMFLIFGLTVLTIYIIVYPAVWLQNLMELKLAPLIEYRLFIVGIAAVNFILCLLVESFFVSHLLFRICQKRCRFLRTTFKYMHIEKEIQNSPEWPPVNKEAVITATPAHEPSEGPPAYISDDDDDDEILIIEKEEPHPGSGEGNAASRDALSVVTAFIAAGTSPLNRCSPASKPARSTPPSTYSTPLNSIPSATPRSNGTSPTLTDDSPLHADTSLTINSDSCSLYETSSESNDKNLSPSNHVVEIPTSARAVANALPKHQFQPVGPNRPASSSPRDIPLANLLKNGNVVCCVGTEKDVTDRSADLSHDFVITHM